MCSVNARIAGDGRSSSTRRTWIEIRTVGTKTVADFVVLHTEDVD